MVTHLELDILECKVKWPLGNITTNKFSGGDEITAELFQILKYDVLMCYTQYVSNIGKLSSGHRSGKGKFSFQSKRKAMPKKKKKKKVEAIIQLQSFQMLAR